VWVNPKYRSQVEQPAPPEDDGRQLAAIPRGDGREELRVTLKAYNGHPYLAVRLWARDDRGWWPQKGKGVSIRMAEIATVMDALQAAIGATGEHQRQEERGERPAPADGRPVYVDRQRRQRPPVDPAGLPRQEGGEGFSEFG